MPGTRDITTTGAVGDEVGLDPLAAAELAQDASEGRSGIGRRRFMGYVIGGATLVAAADMGLAGEPAHAVIPSAPQPAELYDLNDLLTDSARATANLITVAINEDGTASFELHRPEVGQGIMTSSAMLIAEELDLPLNKVRVTLAPARPELLFNQLVGGSNSTISTYTPIRVAAAVAKGELLAAASTILGDAVDLLTSKGGVIEGPSGSLTFGELARAAGSRTTQRREVSLKSPREFRMIGTGQRRLDAKDAVTGKKDFATDLKVRNALPTMVCRAPTLNGTVARFLNEAEVKRMPGVTHVADIGNGIAVRARTFGQCIDAVRKVRCEWNDGPFAGKSDQDILEQVRGAELPLQLPIPSTPLADVINGDFVFWFRSNSAMDTNSAVADVREDSAEIWTATKSPIVAQQTVAQELGLPQDSVKLNVVQGGGSFGRRLFYDGAVEAARISQAMGVPVKLMWHRADDARVGRGHPLATSRVQMVVQRQTRNVLAFNQAHTSVETDYSHGLGEIITSLSTTLDPLGLGNLGFAQTIFALTQEIPYNFGVVAQTLNEVEQGFNTASMRNIYSPDVRTAAELMNDRAAKLLDMSPLEFRREFIKGERALRVLNAAAEAGGYRASGLPDGIAHGIAVHKEYKGVSACFVEIDARPETRNRRIKNAQTGPRVRRVVFAIDAGRIINRKGMEAQMQGGINDGIALALTSSMHLRDGHFLEGSWDNYFYTRQWNTPPEVRVILLDSEQEQPGGAGEAGVASTFAAVACALERALGREVNEFPFNHNREDLGFQVKPFVPPIPQSPTNGLKFKI